MSAAARAVTVLRNLLIRLFRLAGITRISHDHNSCDPTTACTSC